MNCGLGGEGGKKADIEGPPSRGHVATGPPRLAGPALWPPALPCGDSCRHKVPESPRCFLPEGQAGDKTHTPSYGGNLILMASLRVSAVCHFPRTDVLFLHDIDVSNAVTSVTLKPM